MKEYVLHRILYCYQTLLLFSALAVIFTFYNTDSHWESDELVSSTFPTLL